MADEALLQALRGRLAEMIRVRESEIAEMNKRLGELNGRIDELGEIVRLMTAEHQAKVDDGHADSTD